MHADILTLFPDMFTVPMTSSMMYKATRIGAFTWHTHNIRDHADNPHRKIDDTPYGGGGGMILQAPPIVKSVESLLDQHAVPTRVLLMTPQGKLFSHALASELAQQQRLIFICGHYEGVDERVRQLVVTDEISIGDYVLTGGELAAMVILDAIIRFLPHVLGAVDATENDSHARGLLEGPHYTRPRTYRDLTVPEVLLNGDHAAIARWRHQQSLQRTLSNRPNLLSKANLSTKDRAFLAQIDPQASLNT